MRKVTDEDLARQLVGGHQELVAVGFAYSQLPDVSVSCVLSGVKKPSVYCWKLFLLGVFVLPRPKRELKS
jgi:hypothetical protein